VQNVMELSTREAKQNKVLSRPQRQYDRRQNNEAVEVIHSRFRQFIIGRRHFAQAQLSDLRPITSAKTKTPAAHIGFFVLCRTGSSLESVTTFIG
jgi:hypothetical protein